MEDCLIIIDISIHAPREGGDATISQRKICQREFQSTPPARGATADERVYQCYAESISIHAPREGGDNLIEKIIFVN